MRQGFDQLWSANNDQMWYTNTEQLWSTNNDQLSLLTQTAVQLSNINWFSTIAHLTHPFPAYFYKCYPTILLDLKKKRQNVISFFTTDKRNLQKRDAVSTLKWTLSLKITWTFASTYLQIQVYTTSKSYQSLVLEWIIDTPNQKPQRPQVFKPELQDKVCHKYKSPD